MTIEQAIERVDMIDTAIPTLNRIIHMESAFENTDAECAIRKYLGLLESEKSEIVRKFSKQELD